MMATRLLLVICLSMPLSMTLNLLIPLPALSVECPEASELWKRWRELRYELYPVIEAQTPHFEARDFERFWRGLEFSGPIGDFHRRYATEVRDWRAALLTAYRAPGPSLSSYRLFETGELLARWQSLGYEAYLGQQFLHPFESVEFLQNLLLSRLIEPEQLGLFFVRRSQGQTRYQAEQLGTQSWRLWADSYYYLLALDFDLSKNTVKVHGIWGRQETEAL